jgi:hypothetical protein
MAVPAVLISMQLDALFGNRPLQPGEAAVVTLQAEPGAVLEATVTASGGIAVDSPPVRIPELHQICWRIRAKADADGLLRLDFGNQRIERRVRAGRGLRYVRRTEGAVTVDYPSRAILKVHWLVWFAVSWIAAMLFLRRRFAVAF